MLDLSKPWAVRKETFDLLASGGRSRVINATEDKLNPKALIANEYQTESSIAVIPVRGIMWAHHCDEHAFYEYAFGDCIIDNVKELVLNALLDDSVKGIILDIDSPGGDIAGVSELSDIIFNARNMKPSVAYISGDGCSAAYWIASACGKIVINETGIAGSIGVLCQFLLDEKKTIDVVSSLSPKKTIDILSPEGKAQVQAHVDALATVFVRAVARNRTLGEVQVLEGFGQGYVFVGVEAASRGMADQVGNMTDALNLITVGEPNVQSAKKVEYNVSLKAENSMNIKTILKSNIKAFGPKATLVVVDDATVNIPDGTPVEEINSDWIKTNLPDVATALINEGSSNEQQTQKEMAQIDVNQNDKQEQDIMSLGRENKKSAGQIALEIMAYRKESGALELARLNALHKADASEIPGVVPTENQEATEMALYLAAVKKGAEQRGKR